MNKILKDDTLEVQEVPLKVMGELFPAFTKVDEETQKKSNRWIVLKNGKTPDGLSWQLVIQDIPVLENVFYHLYIFRLDGVLEASIPIKTNQPFPPVAERRFGIDYFDWLKIQGVLIDYLEQKKYQTVPIDMDPEGKSIYYAKGTPEEIISKYKRGESYDILMMPAKKFLELSREKQQKEEPKSSLIIPDGNPNK